MPQIPQMPRVAWTENRRDLEPEEEEFDERGDLEPEEEEFSPRDQKSIFYTLPLEIQAHIVEYLDPEELNLSLTHTINPDVIEDRVVGATRHLSLSLRLAHYERTGYQRGIEFLLQGKLLDEGLSIPILSEIGKRGDSPALRFLMTRGIENIDVALEHAIVSYQNTFVLEWINSPITDLGMLLDAAIYSDNLDMMKLLASRLSERPKNRTVLTNHTSYWYITSTYRLRYMESEQEAKKGEEDRRNDLYRTGFGVTEIRRNFDWEYKRQNIYASLLSDLIEPLPFTYAEIEQEYRINYLDLMTSYMRSRHGLPNYGRMEWIFDATYRRDPSIFNDDIWIITFLPLIRHSSSGIERLLAKIRHYLGSRWAPFVDPIQSDEQLQTILEYTHKSDQYIPIQPEAVKAWLNQCIDIPRGKLNGGMIFLISSYPGAQLRTLVRTFPPPMGINIHEMILRFFEKDPIQVLNVVLLFRLLDLWNELRTRMQVVNMSRDDISLLVKYAATAGLNSICEEFLKNDPMLRVGIIRPTDFPRINRLFGKENRSLVRPVVNLDLDDEGMDLGDEGFVAQRLRFIIPPRNDEEEWIREKSKQERRRRIVSRQELNEREDLESEEEEEEEEEEHFWS
jgi:hypothetical protein